MRAAGISCAPCCRLTGDIEVSTATEKLFYSGFQTQPQYSTMTRLFFLIYTVYPLFKQVKASLRLKSPL